MKFLLSVLVFCILSNISTFAAKTPDLVTDRPDQTESSVTVPHKSLQIETGFLYSSPELNISDIHYNSTLMRYGLLEKLELRLGWDLSELKNDINDEFSEDPSFTGIPIGIKYAVNEQDGAIPEFAVLAHTDIKQLADNSDFILNVLFSGAYQLTDPLSFGFNVGFEHVFGYDPIIYIYSGALGYSLTDRLGAFAEIYGNVTNENSDEINFDTGLTYLITPVFQSDISGGVMLDRSDYNPWFFSFGLTYRIDR